MGFKNNIINMKIHILFNFQTRRTIEAISCSLFSPYANSALVVSFAHSS